MSSHKQRINTMVAILNSNPCLATANLNKVKAELRQVLDVHSINPTRRKNLMKILHSTRALDSTLRAFLDHHNIRNGKHSIGQFLVQLQNH